MFPRIFQLLLLISILLWIGCENPSDKYLGKWSVASYKIKGKIIPFDTPALYLIELDRHGRPKPYSANPSLEFSKDNPMSITFKGIELRIDWIALKDSIYLKVDTSEILKEYRKIPEFTSLDERKMFKAINNFNKIKATNKSIDTAMMVWNQPFKVYHFKEFIILVGNGSQITLINREWLERKYGSPLENIFK